MQTGRTKYNEYDDKSHDVKGEVTEYVLPKYIPNLHNGVFVGLPGKTPVDLPLLYRKGIIDDTTCIDSVYDIDKADIKGKRHLKEISFREHLRRHLRRNGVSDVLISKIINNVHYDDIRCYCPDNHSAFRKISAMYIDVCNEYDTSFPKWLCFVDKFIKHGAIVIFNFTFMFGKPKNSLTVNAKTFCPFKTFNMKDDMEEKRHEELSIAANDILYIVNRGKNKYELLELVSYRNNQTEDNRNPCRMGIMVFRKK